MDDAWQALTRYKMLEERVVELRTRAWMNFPPTADIDEALDEAEEELANLKAWIELNFETMKAD